MRSRETRPSMPFTIASLLAGSAAALLASAAGAQCGSGGSCVTPHGTPGCNDASCCELVCLLDPFCCNNQWDSLCVTEAIGNCVAPTFTAGPIVNPLNGHRYWTTSSTSRPFVANFLAGQGLSLASISSGQENEWLRSTLLIGGSEPIFTAYLGINDLASEGTYVWDDGTPATYFRWAPGEPNNSGNEDGVQILPSGAWNDVVTALMIPGIAEDSYSTCGVGGSCFATHAAGCDDESCCNQICEMDPFCCETSWDGICVGEANTYCVAEVISAAIVNPATRSRYFLVDETSWLSAEKLALSLGGNLVTIENAAENAWLLANFTTFTEVGATWIGLHDQRHEGAFEWTSGGSVGYTNWNRGEPNNSGNEDVGMLLFDEAVAGRWNDGGLDGLLHAIIELPCGGDIDGNNATDGSDLATLLGAWGSSSSPADLNRDAIVDAADLAILLGAWGPCPTSNACVDHPTPGSDQPGCNACVCELDPFCCNSQWDSLCVSEAAIQCNVACQCGG